MLRRRDRSGGYGRLFGCQKAIYLKLYSAGNILLRELEGGTIRVEIIDLNRIRFRTIGLEEGCKNFERLPVTEGVVEVLAKAYAAERGFDPQQCLTLIENNTPYKL